MGWTTWLARIVEIDAISFMLLVDRVPVHVSEAAPIARAS